MKTTWIWFDLGYTLLYLRRDELFQNLLARRGREVSIEKIDEAFHVTDKLFMRKYPGALGKHPDTFMPWYHGEMLYYLGLSYDLIQFYADWKAGIKGPVDSWAPYPFVEEELKSLKSRGYKLGVISNWNDSARKILDKHGLTVYFDTIVISCEAGHEKPSREIFEIALKSAGASAGESLYVGDNYYDDFAGSQTVGMDCVIINRHGKMGVEEIHNAPIIPDIRGVRPYLEGKEKEK